MIQSDIKLIKCIEFSGERYYQGDLVKIVYGNDEEKTGYLQITDFDIFLFPLSFKENKHTHYIDLVQDRHKKIIKIERLEDKAI